MRVLLMTDVHYTRNPACALSEGSVDTQAGRESVDRVLRRHAGEADLIAFLGDITDIPDDAGALDDLDRVVAPARRRAAPVLFVRGNHDVAADEFFRITRSPDSLVLGEYLFFPFRDEFEADGHSTRPETEWVRFAAAARAYPGKRLVALQHPVIVPQVDDPYPYNLTGAQEAALRYRDAGVTVSISGHFHAGISLARHEGVAYVTVPALSEAPFRYALLDLDPEIRLSIYDLSPQEVQ